MDQILEMQDYSVKKVIIEIDRILLQLEKLEHTYCCPVCKQCTLSGYDSKRLIIEDLPMSGKRVFIELPVYRIFCSACRKILTEYLPFLQPHQRYSNRFIQFIHHLCAISTVKEVAELTGLHCSVGIPLEEYGTANRSKLSGRSSNSIKLGKCWDSLY